MGPQAEYFDFLSMGQFRIQRCIDCQVSVFFPRTHCPKCGGALEWVEPSGEGVIYSCTTVRRKPEYGGDYNVALVDLREGVRLMTQIIDSAPDGVKIGMPVQFAGIADNHEAVLFRPGDAE